MLLLVLCLTLAVPDGVELRTASLDKYRLPEGFLFGAGWSAYQVEGAWDVDGKGVNVFDHSYHQENRTASRTGDVAADFYHRYKEDIDAAANLGLNTLRLSLSWARIFPTGRKNNVNPKGVQFYHNVLDYMIRKNIEPLVTIFHFDYPQTLEEEFGGWLSNKMPNVFAQFADFVFNEYGRKVRYWLTMNEAGIYCLLAGSIPPGTVTTEKSPSCLHHLLLGHAQAHKIYEEKYRAKFKGLVGFGVGPVFYRPASDSDEDRKLTDKLNLGVDLSIGLSIDVLTFGDYPEVAKTAERPTFTEEQKNLVKGRIDWVGVNMYRGYTVNASELNWPPSTVPGVSGPHHNFGGNGIGGVGSGDLTSAWTLRELPRWIKSRYGDLPVFFTENGMATGLTTDDWDKRAVYCSIYLRELAAGINVDGNNVFGYTLWALTDTFEFGSYDDGWGLIHVDFTRGSLNRTLKTSAPFFRRLTRTWTVPLVEEGSEPIVDDIDGTTRKPDVPSGVSSLNISALFTIGIPAAYTLLLAHNGIRAKG